MDSANITLVAGIFGSFLGFLATLASGAVTDFFKNLSVKKSFRISFRLELKDAQKSLDEIKNARDRQNNTYDFTLLDLLDKSVANLHDMRKSVYILGDVDLQTEVYDVINKLSILGSEMRATQNYEYAKLEAPVTQEFKDTYIKDKKAQHNMQLLDIKRDINELIKKIK